MSYILEALRRSQAERERGQVPGLNAQPVSAAPATQVRRGPWWTPWLAAVLVLSLGLALGWLWLRPQTPLPMARLAAPSATALAPSSPLAALPQSTPTPAPLPVVVSAPALAQSTTLAAMAAAASAGAGPARPPAAELRAVPWAELSADQRRELPPLVVGGAIWSENAASRFVLVNGQVVREGDLAAAGVTLERIGPKSVLLRWRELRIEVPL